MQDNGPPTVGDPFYESQENHNLIGVANIFLECLFHDVKLDYHVPIISQQGEVSPIHFSHCVEGKITRGGQAAIVSKFYFIR